MIGVRVNNYELVSLAGQGGMGAVYLARHLTLERTVAVKVMRRDLAADRDQVARFVNEARAANAVGHPGIIDVIDVGVLPNSGEPGLPYLMMEYLAGEDLGARLDRVGRLSVREAVDIARQVAGALAAAHAAGLVHRDLKPDNLFLVADGAGPRVKVLDFGIAKLRPDLSPDAPRTRTGVVLGTPLYMSPEQCRGLRDGVDHRTDIYALGLILFRMLCGRPAFSSETSADLLVMHLSEPPPRPSSLNVRIPPALEAVILRALAKRPEDRFASMSELMAALPRPNAEEKEEENSGRAATLVLPRKRRGRWLAAAAIVSAVTGIVAMRSLRKPSPPSVMAPPEVAPAAPAAIEAPPSLLPVEPPPAAPPPPARLPPHARSRVHPSARPRGAHAAPAPQAVPPAVVEPQRAKKW